MKRLIVCFLAIITCSNLNAQAPQKMTYQVVVRDGIYNVLQNLPVYIRISITKNSSTGLPVYQENLTNTTNEVGLLAIQFGGGPGFDTINWSSGNYWINSKIVKIGTTDTLAGTSQLLSVPYAFYAETGNPGPQGPIGQMGPQGPTGQMGPQGPIGQTGPQGPTGQMGPQGPAGQMGPQGPSGLTGPQGPTGQTGQQGQQGPVGPAGAYNAGAGITLTSNTISTVWTKTGSDISNNNPGNVGIGTSTPANSAKLDIQSTEQGFLPPRLSDAQMNGIVSPAEGLTIYNISQKTLCFYNGTQWSCMLNTPPFTCGSSTVFYDGQPYNTVLIGTQCWLKENLNVGTMINGSSNQTNNSLIEKYCYDYNLVNCSIYGGLYQWDELMQYSTIEGSKGICPAGWHIPSNNEWCALTTYIDPTVNCNNFGWLGTDAGKKIREAGNTHWDADNTGTNESGFTAFGAGLFDVSSGYMGLLINAYFGTSTENNTTNFFNWNLEYNDDPIGRSSSDKSIGVSVRCLKDN